MENDDVPSVLMLLEESREEKDILDLLSKLFGFNMSAIDVEDADAQGFLSLLPYDDGFKQSLFITWFSKKASPVNSFVDIAKGVAQGLKVAVLLEEPFTERERWILFKPDGSFSDVLIRELEEGVEPIIDSNQSF